MLGPRVAVIGGAGMRGVNLAAAVKRAGKERRWTFFDPEEPLAAWGRVARNIGMTHLRSSNGWLLGSMQAHRSGSRIPLDEFLDVSRAVAENLKDMHVKARVQDVRLNRNTFTVSYGREGGCLKTGRFSHVVVSTGLGEPNIPREFSALIEFRIGVHAQYFSLEPSYRRERIIVVGGGQTGYTILNALLDRGANAQLLQRRRPTVAADSIELGETAFSPGFVELYQNFSSVVRERMYDDLRGRASVDASLLTDRNLRRVRTVSNLEANVDFSHLQAHVSFEEDGRYKMEVARQVVLATGFQYTMPPFLRSFRRIDSLRKGYFSTNKNLEICNFEGEPIRGLHVLGRGAEHTLGPGGRNIGTAYKETEMLLSAIYPQG